MRTLWLVILNEACFQILTRHFNMTQNSQNTVQKIFLSNKKRKVIKFILMSTSSLHITVSTESKTGIKYDRLITHTPIHKHISSTLTVYDNVFINRYTRQKTHKRLVTSTHYDFNVALSKRRYRVTFYFCIQTCRSWSNFMSLTMNNPENVYYLNNTKFSHLQRTKMHIFLFFLSFFLSRASF